MTNEYLQQKFFETNNGRPHELVTRCWNQLYQHYRESHRHYHTLKHLSDLFMQLDSVRSMVSNIQLIEMSIFYHDIIYQPGSADNEERSAVISETVMRDMKWKERDVREVGAYIRSTKTHEPDTAVLNPDDLKLFLDLDLSVLGSDWDTYRVYSKNVMREFGNEQVIKLGRRSFMQKVLDRPFIFHTRYFRIKLEDRARANISREINELLK